MPTLAVPGDVRAVGALSDDVLDKRRGPPAIAKLRAGPLFCEGLFLANLGSSKSGWFAQDRQLLNFAVVKSGLPKHTPVFELEYSKMILQFK